MQNKLMHIYKFLLQDGSTVQYKSEGIFSNMTGKQEDKVLITSAELIDSFFVDADGNRVNDVVEGQVVEQQD
jgi:hypothetical protein